MSCRKSHKNSHHGCIQCKSRRLKCDQEQPSCARCMKKGQDCTYRHLMSSYNPFGDYNDLGSAPDSSTTSSTIDISASQQGRQSLDLTPRIYSPKRTPSIRPSDITAPLYRGPLMFDPTTEQLFYHYATEVSPVFTSLDVPVEVLSSFHNAVIRHSFEHAYVYHSMLTISALHLASLTPVLTTSSQTRSPHIVTALTHKASALETLRSIVNSITASTCEPALAASGLLTVCAFAMLHAGVALDIIDLLAQIMTLYRGTVSIFRFGRQDSIAVLSDTIPTLRQAILTAIIGERAWPSADSAADKVLAEILELSEDSDDAKFKKSVLLDAGLKLKVALRRVAGARGVYNVACMWLAMVHPMTIEYIKAREPLSLILLAHWVIALRYIKHIWWVQGWPERTVQAVWQETGERYPDLFEWIFKEMRGEAQDEDHSIPIEDPSIPTGITAPPVD
ncbi:uncharacterized protein GGS22DRAFT_116813 [Annulohypoxylon maeteangense]|uniref:uncharacterized protein n=1 Tax=Annulohypoxylon maeteangense TaxID=1927788 RepID=UPI002008A293|nr:uncharacterized protein GGS22DRAFT_116813 [Annulohypoxylon maeteangense]KAI0886711.1 hypothetical protein GGS22DRAFT_116813 [Annulohypoxylon maeteangense]